jgi:hypothetical protein
MILLYSTVLGDLTFECCFACVQADFSANCMDTTSTQFDSVYAKASISIARTSQ